MNRLPARLTILLVAVAPLGCGYSSYEHRLVATERRLKDEMVLDQLLHGPAGQELTEERVYLRVPKELAASDQFLPITIPAGYFDVEASFVPQAGAGDYELHVLGRHTTPPKEGQPPPPEEALRGEFRSDVNEVLRAAYGEASQVAPEPVNVEVWPRGANNSTVKYERLKFTDDKNQLVHVYFHHEEAGANEAYDVAMIWVFPVGAAPAANPNPVDLSLGSFAVGARAARYFSGDTGDSGTGGGGEGGGAAVAF